MNKYRILHTEGTEYPYNAQILTSVDGGRTFYYCGNGRFCKTEEEARAFLREWKAAAEGKEKA